MKLKNESLILSIMTIGAVVLAFISGFMANDLFASPNSDYPILSQAHQILLDHTIQTLPEDRNMEYGMIRGMIATIEDPFTTFNEPAQHELLTDALEGVFGGIGVRLVMDSHAGLYLLYPLPDSPAAAVGIEAGDKLIAVDGTAFGGDSSSDEIQAAIRGPEGTQVEIRVARGEAGQEIDFMISRQEVPIPSVTYHLAPEEGRLGIVEINIIAESTPNEILRAVEDLQSQGAAYFAIDLRNNGGGLLEAGVEAARLFLSDGVIIEQQYRDREMEIFRVQNPGPLVNLPVLVWVNHGTASAAEIFAGALQAHNRAQLIGSPTFGKDVIQLVFELRDGSSIQVAAAKWWFPAFAFPNGEVGLLPDIVIEPGSAAISDYLAKTLNVFFGKAAPQKIAPF